MPGKIKGVDELVEIAKRVRAEGKALVTTNGCFDILHGAHVNSIERARREGDVLMVLVNSDSSVRKLKGDKRPIIPEDERVRMLAALEAVDYVGIFNDETPFSVLEKIGPNVHVKGGSSNQELLAKEKALVESWGSRHMILPVEEGFSTTNVIEEILKRHNGS